MHSMEHGDGKVTNYIWEITDAFVEEVLNERPDAVILSGDLSYNGEKASHIELAEKLSKIEDAGIPVLVIPGNQQKPVRKSLNRFTLQWDMMMQSAEIQIL